MGGRLLSSFCLIVPTPSASSYLNFLLLDARNTMDDHQKGKPEGGTVVVVSFFGFFFPCPCRLNFRIAFGVFVGRSVDRCVTGRKKSGEWWRKV